MTILPDGRWKLSSSEIAAKIWEKVKGWRLEDDGRHMVPNFPECSFRKLIAICQPCGKISALNYNCEMKKSLVSVSYCNACVSRGENLVNGLSPPTEETKS